MEVRQLRYVVLLAECLHFGRAAERAFISQPAFSQQIARLETELGTRLFDRRSNRVRLTASGELLLSRAQVLLAALDATVDEIHAIASGYRGVLRIGVFADNAGELAPLLFAAYRQLCPEVRLSFIELTMSSQLEALTSERIDVALLRPPLPIGDLRLDPLFTEPRVAVLPAEHPLAGRESISVGDLADEPFVVAGEGTPAVWSEFWSRLGDRPGPGRVLAEMDSVAEGLASVAYLGAVDTCPATTARHYPHPGVAYVPLIDGGSASMALVRRQGDLRPHVTAFATTAADVVRAGLHVLPNAVPAVPALA